MYFQNSNLKKIYLKNIFKWSRKIFSKIKICLKNWWNALYRSFSRFYCSVWNKIRKRKRELGYEKGEGENTRHVLHARVTVYRKWKRSCTCASCIVMKKTNSWEKSPNSIHEYRPPRSATFWTVSSWKCIIIILLIWINRQDKKKKKKTKYKKIYELVIIQLKMKKNVIVNW